MTIKEVVSEKPQASLNDRFNYGGKIIGVTVAINFVAMAFIYSYGVLLKPIAESFDISRSQASIAPMIFLLTSSLSAPVIGSLLDRSQIRKIMVIFTSLMGFGLMLLALTNTYWQYLLIVGLILGLSMQGMGTLSTTKLLANWFHKNKGIALGLSAMGMSLSATVMPPLCVWLLSIGSWKLTYLVLGCATLLIAPPLILKYVHNHPEDIDLTADFNRAPRQAEQHDNNNSEQKDVRILSKAVFWKIVVIIGLPSGIVVAINTHTIAYLTDKNISNVEAAGIAAIIGGVAMLGKALWGYIFDRLNMRIALAVAMIIQGFGVYLLIVGVTYWDFAVAAAIYGFGMGSVPTSYGLLIAKSFDRAFFGKAMGLSIPVMLPLTIGSVYLAGAIFDHSQSYQLSFQLFIAFFAVAFVTVLLLKQTKNTEIRSAEFQQSVHEIS